MRREKPITNEVYHIYNRGVDKRNVFMNDKDRCRFVHDLFEFNDINPAPQYLEVRLPNIKRQTRKLLVEIMVFCLMPNHFHLLLRQKRERGISEFMQKLGTGYTNYFNQKYERSGSLFQGKFKFIHIKNQTHFAHLPYYIHCNPLDLSAPEWRTQKINNFKKAINFLETYRWSSHLDYSGITNFPSVTNREFLLSIFGDKKKYTESISDWLKDMSFEAVREFTLE